MPRIYCKRCQGIIYDAPLPFIKLPKKCAVCGCMEFYSPSEVDVERERLRALEASGHLISELLKN